MNDVQITSCGPVLLVSAYGGDLVATFQQCANQASQLSAAITIWRIDGDVVAHNMAGTYSDREAQWTTFLALLPPDIAATVRAWRDALQSEIERAERYGL
jgi:hypothetical protein